jgi:hypothetical protein
LKGCHGATVTAPKRITKVQIGEIFKEVFIEKKIIEQILMNLRE